MICFFFNLLIIIFYLFLAVLVFVSVRGLSPVAGERGPLFIAVRGPLTVAASLCCGAQAPDAQAQQLWLTGPVAPRHAGSSQTRARTRVPCIGRQTRNHCATREAQLICFLGLFYRQPCPVLNMYVTDPWCVVFHVNCS